MECRKAKIIFSKPGGTAGKGGISNRVTLPVSWVKKMGFTQDDREVLLSFDGNRIVIEKFIYTPD